MAAPWNPPKKNEDFEVNVGLRDFQSPWKFRVNPTLAAGDVKVSKDDGAPANLATLPTVVSSSAIVKLAASSTEMNADKVCILFHDQSDPPEWCDLMVAIPTTT